MNSWLSVEDDEEVLRAEVELEIERVITENISKVHVEDDVSSDEEGDDGRQKSCMKSKISEAMIRSRLANGCRLLFAHEWKRRRVQRNSALSFQDCAFVHS